MNPILQMVFEIVSAATRLFPEVVAAIMAARSAGTEEEQEAKIAELRIKLNDDAKAVAAVQFKDV